jgi:hypothetical protein
MEGIEPIMEGIDPVMLEGIDPVMGNMGAMDAATSAGLLAFLGAYMFFIFAYVAVLFIIQWKVYVKAGKPGWAALIPIYNVYVLTEIVGRPAWWTFMILIPPVFFIFSIIMAIDLAKSFGKDTGFAIGLVLLAPIFYGILAFGNAEYQGPSAA